MAKKFENVDLSVLVSNDPIQSTSNSDVTLDSLLSIGEIIAPPLVVESQPKEATCPIVHQLSEGLTPIV